MRRNHVSHALSCFWVVSIGLGALGAGCGPRRIPNTEIPDTEDTRGILDVIEKYRVASERRDADGVLALVSERFYEDNGNLDASDDYDYQALKRNLPADFSRAKAYRLEVEVNDIVVERDHGRADLKFTYRAELDLPTGPRWDTQTDQVRMAFLREGGNWKIVRGI